MSSRGQHTGSMLMEARGSAKVTPRDTVPRHALQSAVNRGMGRPEGERDARMPMPAERWGPQDRDTADPQTSPPQDTSVHAHKLLLLGDCNRVT